MKAILICSLFAVACECLSAQSRARADSARVDFTGDGVPEAWIVDTVAGPADTLRLTMSIIRSGKALYTETAVVRRPADRARLERAVRLDRRRVYVLDTLAEKDWSVDEPWYDQARRIMIDQERLDSATARAVVDELKHGPRVALQTFIGGDTSVWRAWSNRLGRFVVIGSCC